MSMKSALIIKCNDNPMAVSLLSRTFTDAALLAFKRRHFDETKNSPDIQCQWEKYNTLYRWGIQEVNLVTQTTVPDPKHPSLPRTHVPESFPRPLSPALPAQTQLPRKQLPAERPPVQTAVVTAATLEPPTEIRNVGLECEKEGDTFIIRDPNANNGISGRGPTQEEATADYFRAVSREREGT